jgi:polar amino acid transport system substrate-binding protein
LLVATLSLLLNSVPSLASEHCPRPYRVGVSQIGYSYYLLDDGTPAGSSFDFYAELSRRTGCTFEIDPLPRVRAWHEAKLQHLDIISPTIRTTERDQVGVFIEYFKARNDILVDRRAGEHIQSLEQLLADPNVKIGLVRGHSSGPYFDERLQTLEKLRRVEFSSYPSNIFIKLQAGRIQATLMTAGIYQKELDQLGLQDQVRIIHVPESDAFSVGLYLSHLTLDGQEIDWLGQHVRAMISDGTLRKLLSRNHGKALTADFYQAAPAPQQPE